MKPSSAPAFPIGGLEVAPCHRQRLRIRVARLPAGGRLALPVDVIHGSKPGPVVFLSGAIHGDELDGVEITRQVLATLAPDRLEGTVVGVPIVNLPGLLAESRYLPDRRDLNRSFPGSPKGSLAARLAHLFMREVVERCSHGIDFHCGSDDRENFPQVRADLDDEETRRMARAFGAPVTIHGAAPAGSLRWAAVKQGIKVLLFEAGEARRFTGSAIRSGVEGTLRVLAELGMTPDGDPAPPPTIECRRRRWIRARRSGIFRPDVALGEHVSRNQLLGEITNALGNESQPVIAREAGIVIGRRIHPIVYQGEALVHLADHDASRSETPLGGGSP